MSAGPIVAIILLLCVLAAAGVWVWLKQQQVIQREAFQALAARRGWSLTISEQKLGRPTILRLTARAGTGWHSESRLDVGDEHGQPGYLTTEFAAQDPHWPEGCLVLTPAVTPAGTPAVTPPAVTPPGPTPPGPLPQGRSNLSLQARVTLAVPSGIAAQLRGFPAPPGLTVQATIDPVHRFDLDALAKVIAAWQPQQHSSDGQPVILISPDGFRVRLSHGMPRADKMEHFIDFALELIRVI